MVQAGTDLLSTTVLSFDPSYDLAVLRVNGLNAPVLTLDPQQVSRGVQAAVLGYPGGGPVPRPSRRRHGRVRGGGRDIYGQGLTVRNVYEIQATVRPGNSGGPLVQPDGQVIGVVFSRSTTNGDIGYALDLPGCPLPPPAGRGGRQE